MRKVLPLILVCILAPLVRADIITFSFIELNAPVVNLTSGLPGLVAGPALNIVVSDTDHHLQFPLSGFFTASTGAASAITSTAMLYDATFNAGGAVAITSGSTAFVSGAPMFDHSHLISNQAEDVGSFAGEFHVASVDPGVLAMFGDGPEFSPDGSVSITTGHNVISGDDLSAIIGGGTVTIQTPAPVPEPTTWMLSFFGVGTIIIYKITRLKGALWRLT